MDSAAVRA